jgi:hypothetical protein
MQNRRSFGRRVSALAAAALAMPFAVRGGASAADVTQTRKVSGFDKVQLNGAFTVELVAGAPATKLTLTGDSALLERVSTTVERGTLFVSMKSGTNVFNQSPKVAIEMPALRSLSNEGAGSIKLTGLSGALALSNDGTATIVAAGKATNLTISINGTGKTDTTALDAHDVTINNNGVGSTDVRVSGVLTASINGIGSIRYTGNPTKVISQVNGLGRISRL